MASFKMELLPRGAADERALTGGLVTATLSAVGKRFSQSARTAAERAP